MVFCLAPDDLLKHHEHCYAEYYKALVAAGVSNYKFEKFRKACDQTMKFNLARYVIFLGLLDFDVDGGDELVTRLMNSMDAVAVETDALKFFKRLPIMFFMIRLLAFFRPGGEPS